MQTSIENDWGNECFPQVILTKFKVEEPAREVIPTRDEWRKRYHFEKAASALEDAKWEVAGVPDAVTRHSCEKSDVMARLQQAAEAGDERVFIGLLEEICWQERPVSDFIHAIQLALESGAHLAARQMSIKGLRYHPADPELQKYFRVLAPPKIISNKLPPSSTLQANRDWLVAHSKEYQGQWLALRNGELLGAAESLEELVNKIGDTKDILLTTAY